MDQNIYKGWTFEQYEQVPALTRRQVCKPPGRSWAEHDWHLAHPTEPTEAMLLGQVAHALLLDEESARQQYFFTDNYPRNTKAGKDRWEADLEAAAGRQIVRGETAIRISAAVRNNAKAWALLADGDRELSVVSSAGERSVKGRLDCLTGGGAIVDVKTTRCPRPETFAREIFQRGIDTQLAWYKWLLNLQGIAVPHCLVIAVPNVEPIISHCVYLYRLTDEVIDLATKRNARSLAEYLECEAENCWPGAPQDVVDLGIPSWAMEEVADDYE